MIRTSARGLAAAALLVAAAPAAAQTERTLDLETRPGVVMRVLVASPAQPPRAAVILLAGGHGNLALAPDGRIGWGGGNQLVRTRLDYARAGFLVATPDMAADLKDGASVKPGIRWSEAHARDLGALVRHLRGTVAKVHLVGTSRAALSATNAAARLAGTEAPDAVVVTAGMMVHVDDRQPSAERNIAGLGSARQPFLLVHHAQDGCRWTPASGVPRAAALLSGARSVDIRILTGGTPGSGDPCEAMSPHGFVGLDREVVDLVAAWLNARD